MKRYSYKDNHGMDSFKEIHVQNSQLLSTS